MKYNRSSLIGHSRKWIALLTAALTNTFLPESHTNFVITHSGKRSALVTDTVFASRGCPLTRTSTVHILILTTQHLSTITNKLNSMYISLHTAQKHMEYDTHVLLVVTK